MSTRPSLEELREAAQAAVSATSLRHVAKVVEVAPSTLRAFLDGGKPLPPVRRKLDTWYPRRPWADGWHALTLMVESLPEGLREQARREIIILLRRYHQRSGTEPPGWLATRLRDSAEP